MPDPTYRRLAKVKGDTYQMYFPLPEATISPQTSIQRPRNTFLGDVMGLASVPAGVFSEALKGMSYNPAVRASQDYNLALPVGWRRGKNPPMGEQSRPSLWLNPKGNRWANTAMDIGLDPLTWGGYTAYNKIMESPKVTNFYDNVDNFLISKIIPKKRTISELNSPNTFADLVESKAINSIEGELDQEYLTALGKAYESGLEMTKAFGADSDKVAKHWDEYRSLYNMGKGGVPYYETETKDLLKLINTRMPLWNENASQFYKFYKTEKNLPVNRWGNLFRYSNTLLPATGISLGATQFRK